MHNAGNFGHEKGWEAQPANHKQAKAKAQSLRNPKVGPLCRDVAKATAEYSAPVAVAVLVEAAPGGASNDTLVLSWFMDVMRHTIYYINVCFPEGLMLGSH